MISMLETKNFKKLGNFKADFTSGTNLVVGPNYAGKTTIFNAIRFALFGTAAIASSAENIPTWGYKSCSVKLGIDGEFLVVRTLKDCKIYKPTDEGDLLEKPELKIAEGSTACSNWVKDYLGIDHKMFSIFNMSMQGETGALITLGATELNRIVESFSGVGVLDVVIKSLSKEISQLEGAAGTVTYTDITAEQKEYKKSLPALAEKVTKAKERFDIMEKISSKVDKAADTYREKVAQNDRHQATANLRATSEGELTVISTQAAELGVELEKLVRKTTQLGKVPTIEQITICKNNLANFSTASTNHTNLEERITSLESRYDNYMDASVKELENDKVRNLLEDELSRAELEVVSLHDVHHTQLAQLGQAKNVVEHGTCKTCNRAFEDYDESHAIAELTKAELATNLSGQNYTAAKAVAAGIKDKIRALPNYGKDNAKQAKTVAQEITDRKALLADIDTKWADFDQESTEAYVSLGTIQLNTAATIARDREKVTASLEIANKKVAMLTAKLAALVVPEAVSVKEEEHLWLSLKDELVTATREHNLAASAAAEGEAIRVSTCARLDKLASENARYSAYAKKSDKAKRLVKFLRESRTKYMTGVWALILGAASKWVNTTTLGAITRIGRNDKNEFTFTENGIMAPVGSEASGAQKEFIGVALRIGLGMSLKGAESMLLLDEPTAGMTEENADKLATGLLAVAGQKILITHRQSERLTAANLVQL